MAFVDCKECGKQFAVIPARLLTARFCSCRCRASWQQRHGVFKKENNPNYRGGKTKICKYCQAEFYVRPAVSGQKFCSKKCADKGGFRYSGKEHPNYRPDARRRNRGDGHSRWADSVIARDSATCQKCGVKNVELHAHHIKSYKLHPELRLDVSNGITLCYKCHWEVHTATIENPVNSVNTRPDGAEGNTEPSLHRKVHEGVTTRGRAYRRWFGQCEFCGQNISKPASDLKGKAHLFCSKTCSAKWKSKNHVNGSNPSKSAGRESDDIV